jgi:hypothetical protein
LGSRNQLNLNERRAGIVHGMPALIGELLHRCTLDIATFIRPGRTELIDS